MDQDQDHQVSLIFLKLKTSVTTGPIGLINVIWSNYLLIIKWYETDVTYMRLKVEPEKPARHICLTLLKVSFLSHSFFYFEDGLIRYVDEVVFKT